MKEVENANVLISLRHAGFDLIYIILQWAGPTLDSRLLQWGMSAVKWMQWAELVFSWRRTACSRVSLAHCRQWPNPSWHVDNKEPRECLSYSVHERTTLRLGALYLSRTQAHPRARGALHVTEHGEIFKHQIQMKKASRQNTAALPDIKCSRGVDGVGAELVG